MTNTVQFRMPLSVIPAKAGIQEVFLSSNVREKKNIDSPLLISGITENENNKEKERKHWIPNQVGDDISVVIPTTSMSFPRKRESRIIRIWIPNQVGDDKLLDPR